MTYVIAEPCINTKDTACVEVCPVDCIHPKKDEPEFAAENKLYIDPETCIDCGACQPACPVEACMPEDEVPEKWKHYIQLNADYTKKWPGINNEIGPMADHEKWKAIEDKFAEFDPNPGNPEG
jgi:ferredoxin